MILRLTHRAPVEIDVREWPEIAAAEAAGADGQRIGGPPGEEEPRRCVLTVRRHSDGRRIVHGRIDSGTTPGSGEDGRPVWEGGELLPGDGDVSGRETAGAIERVGADGGMPEGMMRECIQSLPAVRVDESTPPNLEAIIDRERLRMARHILMTRGTGVVGATRTEEASRVLMAVHDNIVVTGNRHGG